MNDWQQFLAARGGHFDAGNAISFGETPTDYPALCDQTVVVDLGSEGVLAVEGVDGAKFLQGQTTCDFNALSPPTTLVGAFCNPKGRIIADFRAIAAADDRILLTMHRGLVPIAMQVLSKYAVFFKARLSDRSTDYRQLGLAGPGARAVLRHRFAAEPVATGAAVECDGNWAIGLGQDQFLVVIRDDCAQSIWDEFGIHARPVGLPFWQLLGIRAGRGRVFPATSGEFIPQMLNFQATGAISFKKGCYTGQEVVARMQYLGKLKRHMYRLALASAEPPAPGSDVFVPGAGQSAGTLVYAAPAAGDSCEALVVLRDDAAAAPALVFETGSIPVQRAELPYPLEKA